jgi:hypothetical protein
MFNVYVGRAPTLMLGLLLGMRHATDPDHVLAIGTLVSRDPRLGRAVRMGVIWGVGHTLTVMVVGVLMLLCGIEVPPRAASAMDLLVACMLMGLGAASLRARFIAPGARQAVAEGVLVSPLRPLVVGLAGSAGVTLLALASISDRFAALLYLSLFGVGRSSGCCSSRLPSRVASPARGGCRSGCPSWSCVQRGR